MSDMYNIEKAVQKDSKNEDDSILQEAMRVEDENYEQAKEIRRNLGKAAVDQKSATEEMKRQTETLHSAKRSAVGVHREARKGERLADDIEREGSIFSIRCSCIQKLIKWFTRDSGDQEVQDIENREEEEERVIVQERAEYKEEDGFVPGQNKTDKELYGVLNQVRGIRAQAEIQSNEAEKQKTTIRDIGRVNEHSEKVIKRTDEHLKRID